MVVQFTLFPYAMQFSLQNAYHPNHKCQPQLNQQACQKVTQIKKHDDKHTSRVRLFVSSVKNLKRNEASAKQPIFISLPCLREN